LVVCTTEEYVVVHESMTEDVERLTVITASSKKTYSVLFLT
jgi:hypothetical protein